MPEHVGLPARTANLICLAPVADSAARILILGSMPGAKSLAAGQYYAHPRNDFWKIMSAVTGLDTDSPYEQRLLALRQAGIALWDVLQSCARKGSLDSAIVAESIQANDFQTFMREHPAITRVCFNGRAAQQCFNKHVLPGLRHSTISYVYLPSTSPANASVSPARKLAAWSAALGDNAAAKLHASRRMPLRRHAPR